jgi:hypothetical protein
MNWVLDEVQLRLKCASEFCGHEVNTANSAFLLLTMVHARACQCTFGFIPAAERSAMRAFYKGSTEVRSA